MGIKTALKKWYKYFYLKDVLSFYNLDETAKAQKWEYASRLHRGSAAVDYGNQAHLLNCASYVLEAWNGVTETTISNSFRKAETMKFPSETEAATLKKIQWCHS